MAYVENNILTKCRWQIVISKIWCPSFASAEETFEKKYIYISPSQVTFFPKFNFKQSWIHNQFIFSPCTQFHHFSYIFIRKKRNFNIANVPFLYIHIFKYISIFKKKKEKNNNNCFVKFPPSVKLVSAFILYSYTVISISLVVWPQSLNQLYQVYTPLCVQLYNLYLF